MASAHVPRPLSTNAQILQVLRLSRNLTPFTLFWGLTHGGGGIGRTALLPGTDSPLIVACEPAAALLSPCAGMFLRVSHRRSSRLLALIFFSRVSVSGSMSARRWPGRRAWEPSLLLRGPGVREDWHHFVLMRLMQFTREASGRLRRWFRRQWCTMRPPCFVVMQEDDLA